MSGTSLPERLPPDARERVAEALSRHYADDHLTEAELDERLERVYAATTARELEAIIADLPALSAEPLPQRVAGPTAVTAVFSGQERALRGIVPRAMQLRARLGYVELDLTQATFEPGLTTIDVRAFMGYVQIRLPPGVRVENTGRALFGFFSLKDPPGEGRSVVRLTGRAFLGFAEAHVVA